MNGGVVSHRARKAISRVTHAGQLIYVYSIPLWLVGCILTGFRHTCSVAHTSIAAVEDVHDLPVLVLAGKVQWTPSVVQPSPIQGGICTQLDQSAHCVHLVAPHCGKKALGVNNVDFWGRF